MSGSPTADDDALAAASIDPADVGETQLPEVRPYLPGRRQVRTLEESAAEFRDQVLAGLVERRRINLDAQPQADADGAAPSAADVRHRAWADSLVAGEVTDLASWRLGSLAKDQHAAALTGFVQTAGQPGARFRQLILAGVAGPGKTSAAIAAGWAALERGLTVRFVKHAKYLLWLQPDKQPTSGPYAGISPVQLRARMVSADLLILDDLAAALPSDVAAREHPLMQTMELLGDRIDHPTRATIITTNRRSEQLVTIFGDQVLSRLSKKGHVLEFRGPDRRGRLKW